MELLFAKWKSQMKAVNSTIHFRNDELLVYYIPTDHIILGLWCLTAKRYRLEAMRYDLASMRHCKGRRLPEGCQTIQLKIQDTLSSIRSM